MKIKPKYPAIQPTNTLGYFMLLGAIIVVMAVLMISATKEAKTHCTNNDCSFIGDELPQ